MDNLCCSSILFLSFTVMIMHKYKFGAAGAMNKQWMSKGYWPSRKHSDDLYTRVIYKATIWWVLPNRECDNPRFLFISGILLLELESILRTYRI